MAEITRQQNLLIAEDWKKVYQSFRNADFQAYDYENLRKAMIDYLRLYYPEDFNDFIESDEYIALIDLIAFLGQSLAFRADLNTRENFIDTAERRDSVLRLAKLISYKAKRNTVAAGLLKIDSLSTTETLSDSDGVDLTGSIVYWNDSTNPNWLEQFVTIMNAAFISGQRVGKPGNSQTLNGIKIDEYRLNSNNTTNNIYKFQSDIQGTTMAFEVVGATTLGEQYIYEVPPGGQSTFSLLNRNDALGNSSNDTGWFLYFKQGTFQSLDLNFAESLSNRTVSVNVNNINNSDIWFYSVDANGNLSTEWTEIPSVGFSNIAYNTISSTTKTLYEVDSRLNDQIDLVFGDGVFATIPQGKFRLYFRTGNNLSYKIVPNELTNVSISIPYISKNNRQETLTLVASLKYTVTNASARETLDDIKTNAPQQYYTQNRMVNGEDYNILPFTLYNDIIKIKAVNRTSSGISRYLDILDSTGKYSSTNIFCDDGILFQEDLLSSFSFEFANKSDIQYMIDTQLVPLLSLRSLLHYYYANFPRKSTISPNIYWTQVTIGTNTSTGYFVDVDGNAQSLGNYVSSLNDRYYLRAGAIVKFYAGDGKYFNLNKQIVSGVPSQDGENQYLYTVVQTVDDDGVYDALQLAYKQIGPVSLNSIVPSNAQVVEIVPTFTNTLDSTTRQSIVDNVNEYKNFGIGYDQRLFQYYIITADNLNLSGSFSLDYAQDTTLSNLDDSWIIRFQTDGSTYVVYYRELDYVYESELQTRFYFDKNVRVYDANTGTTLLDTINILKYNTIPDTDGSSATSFGTTQKLAIYDSVVENDGYQNTARIKVSFDSSESNGVPTDLDFFTTIVAPLVNPSAKLVFYETSTGEEIPVGSGTIVQEYLILADIETNKNSFNDGAIFYAGTDDKFYQLTVTGGIRTLAEVTNYIYYTGRQDLKFQYIHNAANNRRIDPSPNNIIDLYILTSDYNDSYQAWVEDTSGKITEPASPTTEDLRLAYQDLENYKMLSDSLIFNSATFKPLFGSKADSTLQANFKVVKNASTTISDTEIKVRLITALNTYFAVDNWDFGETFYYTELSAYLHKALAPYVSSIVLVPSNENQKFGSLFQIVAQPNELFANAATVDNVTIIASITSQNINQG